MMPTAETQATRDQRGAGRDESPPPEKRNYVTLDELARVYVQLRIPDDNLMGDPHSADVDPKRAAFEVQLEVWRKNMVDALRGTSSQRPGLITRLIYRLRRQQPVDTPMAIKEYHFSSNLPAGVVLFCDPSSRPFVKYPTDAHAPPWIADLLVRADVLYSEIREILRDPNRGLCLEMVFSRMAQLLKVMEHEHLRRIEAYVIEPDGVLSSHSPNGGSAVQVPTVEPAQGALDYRAAWHMPPWPELKTIFEAQYTQGADLVRRMAQRQAQMDYFWGMVWGCVALVLIVGLMYWYL